MGYTLDNKGLGLMRTATILFCYNRPKYLKKTLESINEIIDYAYVDYSRKQGQILSLLRGRVKNIILRDVHYGLSANIIHGVTQVFQSGYDSVIVIEDDLILGYYFFPYMRNGLEFFGRKYLGSISSNKTNPLMFNSHGWGTWKDIWDRVDWRFEDEIDETGFGSIRSDLPAMYRRAREGKIDSWAIRFSYFHFKNHLNCEPSLVPLCKHIGKNGTNYNFFSNFGIRQYLRKWKII